MSLKAKNLWILELKATAVSTLYSGENKINSKRKRGQGNKLPTRRTVDGHAAISIYGVMRTFAEKIYREEGTCDIGKNAKGCGRCLTCNMFGNLGRKGRVLFEDLKSIKPFNQCTEFTIHPHIDRETGTISSGKGASIELEEIVEGTELTGRILINNPKEKDLEVLLASIKAAEDNGIGGWTKRGKGRVKFNYSLKKIIWSKYKEIGMEETKRIMSTT